MATKRKKPIENIDTLGDACRAIRVLEDHVAASVTEMRKSNAVLTSALMDSNEKVHRLERLMTDATGTGINHKARLDELVRMVDNLFANTESDSHQRLKLASRVYALENPEAPRPNGSKLTDLENKTAHIERRLDEHAKALREAADSLQKPTALHASPTVYIEPSLDSWLEWASQQEMPHAVKREFDAYKRVADMLKELHRG